MNLTTQNHIVNMISAIQYAHPNTQAIYLYGTWGTEHQRRDSDVDVAVLLPVDEAKAVDLREWGILSVAVFRVAGTDRADLINLREVSTFLRKEVIAADRRIYCADENAADEFEMLTVSLYHKLEEERAEIRKDIIERAQVYAR